MQHCPKCATEYPDDSKICRVCGAILEAFSEAQVVPPATPEDLAVLADVLDDSPPAGSAADFPAWFCQRCQKAVPGNFDICWNCFADKDGQIDKDLSRKAAAGRNENPKVVIGEPGATNRDSRYCARCGSNKIIFGAKVVDQGQHSNGHLQVVVYGEPNAMIFKDRRYGRLFADICGQCGHVEFRIENPQVLYEHYRDARR